MNDEAYRDIWSYKPRADGVISVTLDNNMWNWLYEHRSSIRLAEELPQLQFAIFIPREVEIEHLAIPDKEEKQSLKQFIAETIVECDVQTTSYFGFAAPEGEVDRHGAFGVGTFIELEEVHRLGEMRHFYGRRRPSGLARNEADVMLASQSCSSVVLSCDSKPGPLTYAQERGGKVLFVDGSHARRDALGAAILTLVGNS